MTAKAAARPECDLQFLRRLGIGTPFITIIQEDSSDW
jgi:hypothetical protein